MNNDFAANWPLQGDPCNDLSLEERRLASEIADAIEAVRPQGLAHLGCAGLARVCVAAVRQAKIEAALSARAATADEVSAIAAFLESQP